MLENNPNKNIFQKWKQNKDIFQTNKSWENFLLAVLHTIKNVQGSFSGRRKLLQIETQIYTKDEEDKK